MNKAMDFENFLWAESTGAFGFKFKRGSMPSSFY